MRALGIEMSEEVLGKLDEIFPGPGGPAPEAYRLVDERTDVRTSLIGILGYAGAAAALAGLSGRDRNDAASTTERVTADVASVVALVAAGAWIAGGHHEAHERMRSVLWFAAVAVWASAAVETVHAGTRCDRAPREVARGRDGAGRGDARAPALGPRAAQPCRLLALVASVNVGAAAAVYSQGSLFGVGVPQLRWPAIVTIVVGLVTLASGAFDVLRRSAPRWSSARSRSSAGRCSSTSDVLRQAPSDLSLWLA